MEEAIKISVELNLHQVKLLVDVVNAHRRDLRSQKDEAEELECYYGICAQIDEDKQFVRKMQCAPSGAIDKRIKEYRSLEAKYREQAKVYALHANELNALYNFLATVLDNEQRHG